MRKGAVEEGADLPREKWDRHSGRPTLDVSAAHGLTWRLDEGSSRFEKFVRTVRRYRTVTIKAGRQILTAAEPLPDDLAEALAKIGGSGAH